MVDWSELPYDVIVVIADRLHTVEDFVAFCAVCRSWRLVYTNKNWNPSPQVPWLMLNDETNRGFLSTYKNRVYRIPLPEAQDRRCWGSSHGWLVTVSRDLGICLLNPISRRCINLPPISTFGPNINWFNLVQKATVLKIRDEFVTIAIYGGCSSLAFCRLGDTTWTKVKISVQIPFINVVCFRNHIFALSFTGILVIVEIDGPDSPRATYVASPPQREKGWQQIYLVDSSSDLLMVFRYETNVPHWNRMVEFRVYKFDISVKQWIKLETLGDCVLFVDDYSCTSVSACDEYQRNNIYFAIDNLDWWLSCEQKYVGHRMGVYHLKDKATDIFWWSVDRPSLYICPIWVMPNLW